MKTLLIIGSEGFIGTNIRNYFIKKGFNVYCCDLLDINKPNYFNIRNREFLDDFFKQHKIDICINAAGSAHVQNSFENPMMDFEANTILHFYTLHTIRKNAPECKYINFSSAAVYGNPLSLPIEENHRLLPLSPYGYHKMISETICKEYATLYNMKTLNVRVFSAYGPGQNKLLFWDIYQKIKNKKPLTFFGTGKESRDYIYVEDIAKAIDLIIQNHEFDGGQINIANGETIAIEDAIKTFLNAANLNLPISFTGENKIGDPKNWQANISIIKDYGYSPTYKLFDGLKKYHEWLQENEY